MKELTQKEFAQLGGLAVKKKYGSAHFKKIRKLRKNYKKPSKLKALQPVQKSSLDNGKT